MIARLAFAVSAAAALAAPCRAHAQQSPAEVRALVEQISDTTRLRDMERAWSRATDEGATVAAGLAALRLWEVTGERAHARRSRSYFDRAAERDPASAWAHYGHALSLEAEMDREPGLIVTHINALRDLGLDPVSRARRALERAVALDPSLPGALPLLARYAAATRDEDGLLLARTSFEIAASARPEAAAFMGVAATARALGDHDAAADAARRAVTREPESAEAHLELAISLASLRDSLGAAGHAFDDALQLADSALLARMWDDAAMLQTARDSARWNDAEPPARRAVLRTFWDTRGALGGLTGGERAAEHYRRVTLARQRFPRRGMYGAAPDNALRLAKVSRDYDDRGIIYIRHGEPERTVGAPPLQTHIAWFYHDDNGDPLSYHFYKSDRAGHSKDYILVYDLPCPMDPAVAAFDPRLARLTHLPCDRLKVRSISAVIGRDAERALRTDSYRPPIDFLIPFHFDWYTFRARVGTELIVAVGVPLDRLPAGRRSLAVRLAIIDTASSAIVRAQRITELVERSTEPGRILRTHVAVIAAPQSGAYRLDVRDAGNERVGNIYGGDVRLPDYGGDTLMVSDVMLAEPTDSGSLGRGETRLALAPTQVFRDGEFRAYYEIYNLPPDASYVTELTIEPLDGGGIRGALRRLFGGDDRVRLRFEDTADPDAEGTIRQVRDIRAPFEPGAWLLRLTITGPSGSVTRERRFVIEAG